EGWWKARANGSEPWSPSFDISGWPQTPKLGAWDDWGIPELVDRTGMVWYRTTVDLSPAQAAQRASLSIGAVDEIDATWVNGVFVGGGSGGNRTYRLPAGLLHPGANVIAVNILNTYKQGGLLGPAGAQGVHLADGSVVPLPGPWRYNLVPQSMRDPPRAPWESLAGLGVAYNGMVAPLGPYGLKGVVWYQGESDTGEAQAYGRLLTGLMADWRNRFDRDLPFLVVQLPDYGMPSAKPEASGWAKLREAQRAAVAADHNAALVVTIDIGERYDVHPANKQEVGRRLALAARHLVYGEDVAAAGPVAESATRVGRGIAVRFADVENGLVAYGAAEPIGFELCSGADSCRYVEAQIVKGGIVIPLKARIANAHIRYCWGDGPICTLFDGAGLPAAPFDLPVVADHVRHGLAGHARARHATLTAAPLR
ncbi:MAG TPA: sialate O-acetylesterase, partial [Rhizomicrobium sp.]|nr:sialate O-acetylesterase [Rhizomicrobium sp.]